MKQLCLIGALLAALCTPAHSVQIAPGNVGQVLLGAEYAGLSSGFATTLVITNNSSVDAVKAKLVFRSINAGDEVMSVILYLAPSDSFIGKVQTDGANGAMFYSESDSVLASLSSSGPVFASPVNPRVTPLSSAFLTDPKSDSPIMGFVEVIGAYAVRGAIGTPSGKINIVPRMPKSDLYQVFSQHRSALTPSTDTPYVISSVTPAMVQLKGRIELAKPGSDRMRYDMTALEPGINQWTSGFSTKVVNNPVFDVSVMQSTPMGLEFGTSKSLTADNLIDIEAAMSSVQKSGTLPSAEEQTAMFVATPTKYRHYKSNVCVSNATLSSGYSAPFSLGGGTEFTMSTLDASGNLITQTSCITSPCPSNTKFYLPHSSNYMPVSGPSLYPRGQLFINLLEAPGCPYVGVPSIFLMHSYTGTGSSIIESMTNTAQGVSVAERIFKWAEAKYPDIFKNPLAPQTQIYSDTAYQQYATGWALGERRGSIVFISPSEPGMINVAGSSMDFLYQAKQDGF